MRKVGRCDIACFIVMLFKLTFQLKNSPDGHREEVREIRRCEF